MSHNPYRWRGSLYCDGDIVGALTEAEPYSGWAADHEPGIRGAETELDELAAAFGIDRTNDFETAAKDFPVRLSEVPHPPAFCCRCLNWFT